MSASDVQVRIARIVVDAAADEARFTPAQWHEAIVAALESRVCGGEPAAAATGRDMPLQAVADRVAQSVHSRLPLGSGGRERRAT